MYLQKGIFIPNPLILTPVTPDDSCVILFSFVNQNGFVLHPEALATTVPGALWESNILQLSAATGETSTEGTPGRSELISFPG